MTDYGNCTEVLYGRGRPTKGAPCGHQAKDETGKCGIHHPDAVARRKARSDAEWNARSVRRREVLNDVGALRQRVAEVVPDVIVHPRAIQADYRQGRIVESQVVIDKALLAALLDRLESGSPNAQ